MPPPLNGNCTPDLASKNLGPLIGTLGWVEATMAIKVIIARFLVQRFVVGRLEWNDWVMLFALVRPDPMALHDADPNLDYRSGQHQPGHALHLLRSRKALGMPHPRQWCPCLEVGVSGPASRYHESSHIENCLLHVYAEVCWYQQEKTQHLLLHHHIPADYQPRDYDRSLDIM